MAPKQFQQVSYILRSTYKETLTEKKEREKPKVWETTTNKLNNKQKKLKTKCTEFAQKQFQKMTGNLALKNIKRAVKLKHTHSFFCLRIQKFLFRTIFNNNIKINLRKVSNLLQFFLLRLWFELVDTLNKVGFLGASFACVAQLLKQLLKLLDTHFIKVEIFPINWSICNLKKIRKLQEIIYF